MKRILMLSVLTLSLTAGLVACKKDEDMGPAEKLGKTIDQQMKTQGQNVKDVDQKVKTEFNKQLNAALDKAAKENQQNQK